MLKKARRKPIIISPQAKQDINDILFYLTENWNQKIVTEFLERLEAFYLAVSSHPRIFGYYNKHRNIRKYALTKYNIIFYRNKINVIEIITVFDGRQNPAKLKKKLRG